MHDSSQTLSSAGAFNLKEFLYTRRYILYSPDVTPVNTGVQKVMLCTSLRQGHDDLYGLDSRLHGNDNAGRTSITEL